MEQEKKQMKLGVLIKRFLPYFGKYKGILIFDLVCASLTTVCDLVFPLIVRNITDLAVSDPAALTIAFIVKLGVLYLILRLLDAAANFYMQHTGHVMGAKIETDMRRDLFSHLQKLSFSYFATHKVGQIMSRITSDLFDITEFAHHGPEEFFIAGLKITVSFVILFGIDPLLTIIVFAVLPFIFIFVKFFNTRMRRAFKDQRVQVGEINSQVEDSLLGIRVVKSFANEQIEKDKFDQGNREFLRLKKLGYLYMGGFGSTNRFFEGVMYLTVVVAGSLFLMKGSISAGDFTAYLLYVSSLFASIRTIIQFTEQFQRGMTGIERFCEIMDAPQDIIEKPDAKELKNVKGEIDFNNVTFHYSDDDTEVLSGIDLHVPSGTSVALVGPSGGGKTTMCNLIPRFYDVTEGKITIDGIDIKDVTLRSLRSSIGVVQQDVYLFSGTVFDNIEYGKPGASREEVIEAAKAAGAHEFISSLPDGYDTYVGERGVKLSGGQKQRISIARVFLKNPPILILDEATSALDNESEKIVQESLERLAAGRTVLTIAHRLTTIKNSDKILVLTDKGIEEEGTHKELIKKGGIYSHLYSMYATM
ncbi:MAG TPA: ABC transporter ATP-binding protein [Candidatus Ornithomonoglobus merdipullorum]|uniref:ABC transporter ATP-binding protein n=1 Tax=Candidatus Ornithomonoglobus merdipullorum TaxID=2840895 RepID=A0A9D1MDX7_9FIRM|nr:ABC transporter ATP-binding protein [Candidatus Ornithomonoglobus merdipullorum]